MSILVIVESPSKTKTIKKILGSNYRVEASMGHIRDLPKDRLGVDVDNGFKAEYVITNEKTVCRLKSLAKDSEKVILASDPDREGEAIAWHLETILKSSNKNFLRAKFHAITKNGVEEGIRGVSQVDLKLVAAQQARRLLDRLVGYKISPVLWGKFNIQRLSAGRVQSVAVRLVCERQDEIDNFVPVEFWKVYATLRNSDGRFAVFELISKGNDKLIISNEDEATYLINLCNGKNFLVDAVDNIKKEKKPFPPYITSSYQSDMSAKLNIKPKKAMDIAQTLFEGIDLDNGTREGLITYHRTDSVRVSPEFQKETSDYIGKTLGPQYVPLKPQIYNTKEGAQDAHECIRPTSITRTPKAMENYLKGEELNVYCLIYNRYVASQMANAVYDITDVLAQCSGYIFKVTGKIVIFDGHLKVYNSESKDKKDSKSENDNEDKTIPKFIKGETLICSEMNKVQKFTKHLPYYTEATLIQELEKRGIGRPSTYASILNNIIGKYIENQDKRIVPMEIGKVVNKLLVDNFPTILDINFTKSVEDRFDEIAEGKIKLNTYLSEFYGIFSNELNSAIKNIKAEGCEGTVGEGNTSNYNNSGEVLGKCPGSDCKGEVIDSKNSYRCTNYNNGCKFIIMKENKFFEAFKSKITKSCVKQLLKSGTMKVKNFTSSKDGSKFEAELQIVMNDETKYWGFKFKDKNGEGGGGTTKKSSNELGVCPFCSAGKVVINKSGYGCTDWKTSGCKFFVKFIICGKKITETNIKQLIAKGKTELIKGFSKDGASFDAALIIKDKTIGFIK